MESEAQTPEPPYFGGISGAELPVDEFEFGRGLILRRTYCHVFAGFMAAFAKPAPGQAHPAPWKSLNTAISYDILGELEIPLDLNTERSFDRLNTIWWLVSLMRLKVSSYLIAPVIATCPFNRVAAQLDEAKMFTVEVLRRRLVVDESEPKLSLEALNWIKQHWQGGAELMREDENFSVAFQAFDQSTADRSSSVALLTLWGALERLFSRDSHEVTFKISNYIASYLEERGPQRLSLFKAVKKLYGERSKVAHGSGDNDREPFLATYGLMRRVLVKMIEARRVPTRDDLEAMVLS